VRLQRNAARAVSHYERGLARIAGSGLGKVAAGEAFRDAEHVYTEDLDIFGKGSLFELVSTARTFAGESMLASWFRAPASHAVALERQEAARELTPAVELREDLALTGDEMRAELDAVRLREWGAREPVRFFPGAQWVCLVLGTVNFGVLVGWFLGAVSSTFLLAGIFAAGLVTGLCRRSLISVATSLGARPRDLELVRKLMERLSRESFQSPRLAALHGRLGRSSAAAIGRLQRLVEMLDSARNMVFAPIAFLTCWTPWFANAIEGWRAAHGREVGEWLDALAEIEALSSLGGFAYEHPGAVFPQLLPEGRTLDLEGVEHPLIAEGAAVPNDVHLSQTSQLLMVSGSNMSGKSTLLRATGISVVLAWAGAPVRAKSMSVSPFAVGASIRATDSVMEGRSRFFAEITRLKQIQQRCSQPMPVLFLLDELLSGTNSHDRRIGAEAYLKGLLGRGAIGLATTHDLALTQIADQLAPHATNVHLADTIANDQVTFDYKLRPGVVARGNALALMRAVGLETGGEQ
jgi:hypothetical protein